MCPARRDLLLAPTRFERDIPAGDWPTAIAASHARQPGAASKREPFYSEAIGRARKRFVTAGESRPTLANRVRRWRIVPDAGKSPPMQAERPYQILRRGEKCCAPIIVESYVRLT